MEAAENPHRIDTELIKRYDDVIADMRAKVAEMEVALRMLEHLRNATAHPVSHIGPPPIR